MPMQRKEPRIDAVRRFFLRALERKKALAISSVMNILPVLDAVLAILESDKCLKRLGLQLVQLMFATAVLSSTVLPRKNSELELEVIVLILPITPLSMIVCIC